MDIFKKVIKNPLKKTKSKSKKNKTKKLSSPKLSNSNSYKQSLSGSPTTKLEQIHKNITRKQRDLGIDQESINLLSKKVNSLERQAKQTFTRKRSPLRRKPKSNSPIMLTIKNLDTGKQDKVTVAKNLNTGKYEFINI